MLKYKMRSIKSKLNNKDKKIVKCFCCKKTSETININTHQGDVQIGLCDDCVQIFRGEP
jgi:hypothetical protein